MSQVRELLGSTVEYIEQKTGLIGNEDEEPEGNPEYNPFLDEAELYVERWLDSHEDGENYFEVGLHDSDLGVEFRIKYFSEYENGEEEVETGKTVIVPGVDDDPLERDEVEKWVDRMMDDYEDDLNTEKTGISTNIEWGAAD